MSSEPRETSLTRVTCNHCGAPLELPEAARFVTCSYCNSRLEVHRSGNAIYTEVLSAIEQRTKDIAEDVEAIRRQNEVERLDREWAMRREEFFVRDKHGRAHHPGSGVGGMVGAVIAVIFGIFWIGTALSAGAPPLFALFGVVFIIVAAVGGITSMTKASGYLEAEREYQHQRQQLLRADRRRD